MRLVENPIVLFILASVANVGSSQLSADVFGYKVITSSYAGSGEKERKNTLAGS
jgi:hypothetical protein